VPTKNFVKGINNIIRIINGIDLKILTNAATNELIVLFSHIFPFAVKNNSKPRKIPIKNVASTEIPVI
jgi:hypothetical protein